MLFYLPANQTQSHTVFQYVTDVGHTGPHGNYLNITQRLISPSGFPLFTQCCFHPTRCIVGPICLIIDDEGAISCLRSQGEDQRRLAVEELENKSAAFS